MSHQETMWYKRNSGPAAVSPELFWVEKFHGKVTDAGMGFYDGEDIHYRLTGL